MVLYLIRDHRAVGRVSTDVEAARAAKLLPGAAPVDPLYRVRRNNLDRDQVKPPTNPSSHPPFRF